MKMDLQGLSLSEVGPQSIWDGFVMTEVAKNFQSFTTSKIPYHFKSLCIKVEYPIMPLNQGIAEFIQS